MSAHGLWTKDRQADPSLTERNQGSWISLWGHVVGARRRAQTETADLPTSVGSSGAPSGSARPLDGLPPHVKERLRTSAVAVQPGVTIIDLGAGHMHVFDDRGREIAEYTRCRDR